MKIYSSLSIIAIILTSMCSVVASQEYKSRPMKRCEEIAATCNKIDLDFPFNNAKRLKYNGCTYLIAQRIEELQEGQFLEDKSIRVGVLREIIHQNWKIAKNLPIEGKYNFGAFQDMEKEVDTSLLLAAMILAGKYQEIVDIEPFLEFATLHFGSPYESKTMSTFFYADYYANKDLTEEQSMQFWPAASAILNNATVTIPLLSKALLNADLPEILRLRAAAFLKELDPDKLSEILLTPVKDENSIKLFQCISDRDIHWKAVYPGICDPNPIDYERLKRDRERDERITKMIEERKKEREKQIKY